MSQISKTEIEMVGQGHVIFAQMMASMSMLSDAQELLTDITMPTEAINDTINHAKAHLGEAMGEYFHKNEMSGVFAYGGGFIGDHSEEKGEDDEH